MNEEGSDSRQLTLPVESLKNENERMIASLLSLEPLGWTISSKKRPACPDGFGYAHDARNEEHSPPGPRKRLRTRPLVSNN